jgi:3-oxoacyl-[acyl-carrier-protein] synthase II
MRRVVVTGLGLVTPLGADVETAWKNIIAAKSGAGTITRFDATDFHSNYACEVKPAGHEYGFDPNLRVDHKVQRQVDPFIIFGIDAAGQAIEDAGLLDMDEEPASAPAARSARASAACRASRANRSCSPKRAPSASRRTSSMAA